MSTPLPHFTLTNALIQSLDADEAYATCKALAECGLLSLPYPAQTITFSSTQFTTAKGWQGIIEIDSITRYDGSEMPVMATITRFFIDSLGRMKAGMYPQIRLEMHPGHWTELDLSKMDYEAKSPLYDRSNWGNMVSAMASLLVTALNTKNIVQHTKHNKRALTKPGQSKGVFKSGNVIHLSCTKLDLPPAAPGHTGKRMPMHLRRGHVHRWLKGDGSYSVKFLPAILVNKNLGGVVAARDYEVTA